MTNGHSLHPSILREYDIRGIAGETVHAEDAHHIGRAFAAAARQQVGRSPTLIVACDGRLSSPALHRALLAGLTQGGAQVIDLGVGPTPMMYFGVHHLDTDGGIMVTGSHNPPTHNGFKFMLGKQSFFGADIRALGKSILAGTAAQGGGGVRTQDITDAYITRLLQDVPRLTQAGGKTLRVAWDPGNGAAGAIIERLTKKLAGAHVVINAAIDGHFPAHHPDPSDAKNLQQLTALVGGEGSAGFDLGIAFDGDADRIGVIDRRGRIVWGDQLLQIYARELAASHPGAIVIGDVKSSRSLIQGLEALGLTPMIWKTGHSLIKAKMKESGALLAGEMSGHMFFADRFYGHDDAIYAALRLLNILADPASPTLGELLDAMPAFVGTPEIKIPCPDTRKFAVIEEVKARLAQAQIAFNAVDGARVEKPHGWWLLRASNTGPHLIMRAEAQTQQALATLSTEAREQLALSAVPVPDGGK